MCFAALEVTQKTGIRPRKIAPKNHTLAVRVVGDNLIE